MLNIIYRAKYWRRANLLWDSISQQEAITTSSFIIKPIKWPQSLFEVELVKEWIVKSRSSFSQILHLSPHTLVSLINVKSHLPTLKIPPSTFIDFITKLSYILTEPNDDFLSYETFRSKINGKMPVDFATFAPLHVFSNLYG